MTLHLEIFDQTSQAVFYKLAAFKKIGYLAGGTALALQIGHRLSYDFDIFCAKPIKSSLVLQTKKIFTINKIAINNEDEYTFFIKPDIKISFIHYPFNLKPYYLDHKPPLPILSPAGIAISKAYTLNRRNSWRDYVDLYFLLKNNQTNLKKLISEAQNVYKELFSEKLFLAQLLYTDDISPEEIKSTKTLKGKVSLALVKNYFKKLVESHTKTLT